MLASITRRIFLKCLASAGLTATGFSLWPRLANAWGSPTGSDSVDALLGSTLFYDEYKGNYAQARKAAERLLAAARQSGAETGLADAWVTLGVVQLLQGRAVEALASLAEADPLIASDAARQLRILVYRFAATSLRFNTFPNGSGASGAELDARWDGLGYVTAYEQKKKALQPQVNDAEVLMKSEFLADQLCGIRSMRAALDTALPIMSPEKLAPLIRQTIGPEIESRDGMARSGAEPRSLAYVDLVIGDLYRRAGDSGRADEFLHRAGQGYRSAKDWAGLAVCSMTEGDWLAAPYSSPQVLNFHLGESSSETSNPAWTVEARELRLQGAGGDTAKARRLYDQAERDFKRAGAPRGLAAIALRRGYLAAVEGDYGAAIRFATAATSGFEASGDRRGAFNAAVHVSLSRVGAGELVEDRETALQVGRWGATEGSFSDVLGLGLMAGRAGRHWLLRAGDFERAASCYRIAEAVFEGLGAMTNQAQSLADQATLMKWLGEQSIAVTLFERAVDTYQLAAKDRPKLSLVAAQRALFLLSGLSQVHQDRNDPEALERVLTRMQQTMDLLQGGAPQATESAMERLAKDWKSGQTMDGDGAGVSAEMDLMTQVMNSALVKFAGDLIESTRVMVPGLRIKAAMKAGDRSAAAKWLEQALDASEGAPSGQRDFYRAIAYAYAREYGPAKESFQEYLAQGGADAGFAGKIGRWLAETAGESGRAELLKQSRRTHEQAAAFYAAIKAYAEAKEHLDALESLAGKDWWNVGERPWEGAGDYGAVYEGLGRLPEAASYYRQGIAVFESRRQQLRRDELRTALSGGLGAQYLYFGAARTALKLGLAAEAAGNDAEAQTYLAQGYGYAEQGKSRGLLDLMAGGAVTADLAAGSRKSIGDWHQANAQLATWRGLLAGEQSQKNPSSERTAYLGQRVAATEAELRRAEAALARAEPGFYQAINPQSPLLDARQVAAKLPADTALLQYYLLGEELLVWGIADKGPLRAHLTPVDVSALSRQIRAFHQACERREAVPTLAAELGEVFLAPMAELIDDKRRLIVVPYGAAHLLPFQVLPWKGQPLVATHSVSYLPSASLLQFVKHGQRVRRPGRILAVGNPTGMAYRSRFDAMPEPQPPLPAAGVEAAFVAGLFPNGRALIGAQATESAVRGAIGDVPLLHFATHGMLSEETPLLSSLLLADGEALTVYELMGIRLHSDLVVLSACRTGQGQTTGGDDVLGFTRGLLAAGAGAAVVGLWPVDDLATSLLMEEFYRQLREGRPGDVALQRAQNHLRTLPADQVQAHRDRIAESVRGVVLSGDMTAAPDYAHPFYWAPFVLVG